MNASVSTSNGNTQNPTSYTTPTSYTKDPDNVINVDTNTQSFYYAVISSEDTIKLKSKDNQESPINLDQRKWSDLKPSADSKLISVIGQDSSGIRNIYVFDFLKKSWTQVTKFKEIGEDVKTYFWKDSSTIIFPDGVKDNRWLHSYNYKSGELLKIGKISDGEEIASVSPSSNYIIFKKDSNFIIRDKNGLQIQELKNIKDENDKLISINSAFFLSELNYGLQSTDLLKTTIYKGKIGEQSAISVVSKEDYSPLCIKNKDGLVGFAYSQSVVSVFTLNLTNVNAQLFNTTNKVLESTEVKTISGICQIDGSIFFKVESPLGNINWYILNSEGLQKTLILNNDIEVIPLPL